MFFFFFLGGGGREQFQLLNHHLEGTLDVCVFFKMPPPI